MKILKKIKVLVEKGAEKKREEITERPVVDSVADDLLIQSKEDLAGIKEMKGVRTLFIWEEVEQFDVNKAKGDDLKAYAKENNIDLGENTKVDDIRACIKEALKTE